MRGVAGRKKRAAPGGLRRQAGDLLEPRSYAPLRDLGRVEPGQRIPLKRAYADGTVAVDMEPLSLLWRLATSGCQIWRFRLMWWAFPMILILFLYCFLL